MSCLIINRGGASGGLKPELTVTALPGSTIDLLQGGIIVATYTLGAEETEHTFIVQIGTYTVKSVFGTKEAEAEVVIDTVGQYEVELKYRLWLYREGNEFSDVTGGWVLPTTYYGERQNAPNGTVANWVYDTCNDSSGSSKIKNEDNILLSVYIAAGSVSTATVALQNAVDLTPFTKLCVEVTESVNGGFNIGGRTKYKWPGAILNQWGGDDSDIVIWTYSSPIGLNTIDISGVSGLVNLAAIAGGYSGSAVSGGGRFTEMWLE